MNPFSTEIRRLRELRGFRQKEAAEKLGYEASYLSAIELGQKDPPKYAAFLEKLVKTYQLTEAEHLNLKELLLLSKRTLTISRNASEEEFYIGHQLESKFGTLNKHQIYLIKIALCLNELSIKN